MALVSDTTSPPDDGTRPPIWDRSFTSDLHNLWQNLQGLGQQLVPSDHPWYQKALDVAEAPVKLAGRGIGGFLGTMDEAMHDPGLLLHPDLQHQVTQQMTGLMGGSVATPLREAGTLGVFGGVKAEGADLNALARAQALTNASVHPSEIWNQTGWWKGPGGDWRFEIPDESARMDPKWLTQTGESYIPGVPGQTQFTLQDVLDHKALFDAYPDLRNLKIHSLGMADIAAGVKGAFSPPTTAGSIGEMTLAGGKAENVLSTILHETQHAVQRIEGFPRGGNVNEFLPKDFDRLYNEASTTTQPFHDTFMANKMNPAEVYNALNTAMQGKQITPQQHALIQNAKNLYPDSTLMGFMQAYKTRRELYEVKLSAFDKYENLAGEVEARSVQARQKYTPEERRGQYPPAMEGYPREPQVIKRYNISPFSLEPVDHDPFER